MPRGHSDALYILPFDHRGSFETQMFGWHGELDAAQSARIAEAKQLIFDGFKRALEDGAPRAKAGILVDEQFGAPILREAKALGVATACPAEKSGQEEFDFEYGADFGQHIEAFEPDFCKVLVRYNPDGDAALNGRQQQRLKKLSDWLQQRARSKFMFELLVPAEAAQLARVGGDSHRYDLELRPQLMVRAIEALQRAGIEPDVWKVEGLERREHCEQIVAAARAGGRASGRQHVGCIVLGRGENDAQVDEWLATAASVDGFIGFAVGRTDFWQPLVGWRDGTLSRDGAAARIAQRYLDFVALFEQARAGGKRDAH